MRESTTNLHLPRPPIRTGSPAPQRAQAGPSRTDVNEPLKVLVIDEELPFPTNSGKRVRSFNLLRRLAKQHSITYLAHRNSDPEEAQAAAAELERCGITTHTVDWCVPRKSGLGFYARLACSLCSPLPYSVWSHRSRALQSHLCQLLSTRHFDLVHCEWTPYLESLRHHAELPVVVSAHNIESQIWQRYHETEGPGLTRWFIGRQWKRFQHFERWAFSRADQVIFVSEGDADLARQSFHAQRATVVANGVDTDAFQPTYSNRDANELLIMGSLDWRPNIDGIEQFLKLVFPRLRREHPELRLAIIGRSPNTGWAAWVSSIPGVRLHANIPDVRPYLEKAGCLVVPLRIGGGSRLKILEAAASGLPVVSTRIGAEGLRFESEKHYLVSDNIEEIGKAIGQQVRSPEAARDRAIAARELVENHYSWDTLANRQDACWREVAESGHAKRRMRALAKV